MLLRICFRLEKKRDGCDLDARVFLCLLLIGILLWLSLFA